VVRHALGDDVIFTGRTVLWLRQITTGTPSGIDVWSGPQAHYRGRKGVVFSRGAWVPSDAVTKVDGFATAPVRRAFTDVARVAAYDSLLRWLPAADRRRLMTLDALEEYVPLRGAFPGVVNLRAAMAVLRSDLPHSDAERFARRLVRDAGLRPYPRPYAVKVAGVTIAEIDIAVVPAKYGAEVDGPHHQMPEVIAADKARDRKLRALGWRIDRFPVEEIEADPEGFVAEVKRGLTGP
jgi:very-short-patch-repair endonuclease